MAWDLLGHENPEVRATALDELRVALGEAGDRRARAERDRAEAMVDIARLGALARTHGVEVTEIARLTGVTRPTIYKKTLT